MQRTLFVLDGHGLIFRAYYAHIRNPLINSRGKNTSAVFGFFQAIRKIFTEYSPRYFVVALDSRGDTFRNELYADYKANRDAAPEDLQEQIPVIIDILSALEIPYIEYPGMEADDIIASLTHNASKGDMRTSIISADKDLFQLLSDKVDILRPSTKSSDWEAIDTTWLQKEWELNPEQVRDYLAIIGDTSDNIPGIKGLGPKSALALLHEYNSFANILEHIDSLKESWRKKLYEYKEQGILSYELVGLKYDLELPGIDTFQYDEVLWEKAKTIFHEQEIYTFNKKRTDNNTNTDKDVAIDDSSGHSSQVQSFANQHEEQDSPYNTAHDTAHQYVMVKNSNDFDTILKEVLTTGYVAIDTETDSLDTITAVPVGISLSTKPHTGYYIPLQFPPQQTYHIEFKEQDAKKCIQQIFDDSSTIIMHNSKFDIAVLENWGIDLKKFEKNLLSIPKNKEQYKLFDTMIAAWMCTTPTFSYSMDELSKQMLKYRPISFKSLTDDNNNPVVRFSTVPLPQALEYAVEDTDITLQLYLSLSETLQTQELFETFHKMEMPLLIILHYMEKKGISIDTRYMAELSKELEQSISLIQQEIYELCGEVFNINSPKQLQEILFKKLGLNPVKKNKTGFSTDIAVLEFLSTSHPVPQKILDFRHLSKLKSTYTDSLPEQVHPFTKRIHTNFQQTGTETGRIASIQPNLQNIPIKDDWGKKIRSAFIPSSQTQFISADYSQIELVVLAHLSQDKNMIEAFKNNIDIHKRTASILFEVGESKVDDNQRRIAKTINFGVIYGMSAFRLGNELKIPQKDSKEFIQAYFTEFSGVTQFIADTIVSTQKNGFTTTLMGHKRAVSNISSANHNLKKAAERIAVNTTIQGSAAEIVKESMLQMYKQIQKHKLKSKIILQIHDELLFECPQDEVEQMMEIVPFVMENAVKLSVPLRVSISRGNNWGELK